MSRFLKILLAVAVLSGIVGSVCAGNRQKTKEQRPERTAEDIAREAELKYFFYEAMRVFDKNRFDETMALLKHCERVAPDDPATAYYLGILYGGLHDRERMLRYFDKAYGLCPEEYWYAYAVQHYKAGSDTETGRSKTTKDKDKTLAIKALQKEIKRSPDESKSAEVLQQIYINEHDIKQALKMQDIIDGINGMDMQSAIQRYRLSMAAGKPRLARAAIENYLKYDPDNYYMQVFQGDVLMQQGDAEGAYEQYMRVEREYPENPYLALSLSNYYGVTGDTEKAAEYELHAIDNEAVSLEYKLSVMSDYQWLQQNDSMYMKALESIGRQYPQEVDALLPLAEYKIKQGEKAEAEELLWTILDINPKHIHTWQSLLSLMQTDTTATDSDYLHLTRAAISHMPEQQQWYSLMSILQLRQNQRDSAIYYCHEGLRQPDNDDLSNKVSLIVQLADIHVMQESYDSAFHYYEEALKYNPENAYVLNNYAYTLAINGGDLRKAEKMSQRTIKQEPDNPTYLDTYAWILHLEGQETLARFYMQKAWDNSEDKTDKEMIEHYEVIFGKKGEK